MSAGPLRILQILRAPVGGLFRHVYDLTEEFARRGHMLGVIVDSMSGDAMTADRLDRLGRHTALGVHPMPMPRLLGLGDVSTPLRVRALARRLNIQIMHGHGAKGGTAVRTARIGLRDTVALYTPHGGVLHFSPRSAAGFLFRGIERSLAPLTGATIFESAFAERAFRRQIGAPGGRVAVIHNGLRPAEFEPVQPLADAADFVFVGEFRTLKGIAVLLDAIGPVQAAGRPATLAMAGDGPDADQFRAQIGRLQLAKRVRLLGVVPAREAFRHGRIAVVPSFAESLPYIVLEATAAGLPVIATRVGGIPEIFGPTADALIEPGSVPALRSAMQRFLDEPAAAAAEARARLDHVRRHFALEAMVDIIEALYRSLLEGRSVN